MWVNTLIRTGNILCHIQAFYRLNYIHHKMKTFIKLLNNNYVGVVRTLNNKHQKFMTYRLVYNIYYVFMHYKRYKHILCLIRDIIFKVYKE